MTPSVIKTKYTKISFNEDTFDGTVCSWATVELAWGEKADARSVAFATLMDDRLVKEARRQLGEAVNDQTKDIYLEDVDLLVNLKPECKHLAAKLIGLVEVVEKEFDALVESGRSVEKAL